MLDIEGEFINEMKETQESIEVIKSNILTSQSNSEKPPEPEPEPEEESISYQNVPLFQGLRKDINIPDKVTRAEDLMNLLVASNNFLNEVDFYDVDFPDNFDYSAALSHSKRWKRSWRITSWMKKTEMNTAPKLVITVGVVGGIVMCLVLVLIFLHYFFCGKKQN
ncbi:Hypothetical protein FKW44_010150 [Caligus rogercresseyi]|uniref:Uncharacterized protein n=1 Tax=Caligus rogercresseyi TaxID=217165 RepID=A0A7T8K754_CALRO|nr:Hypothetical protein FKW44_010150 [Caligus rogercresseyi]